MNQILTSPREWAQNEFGFAQLGDQRRNRRLVKIAQELAAHPGGTLPQTFCDWAEQIQSRLEWLRMLVLMGDSGVIVGLSEDRTRTSRPGGRKPVFLGKRGLALNRFKLRMFAVLAVVAIRLLNTKMLARSFPEGTQAVTSFGPELLKLLAKQIWRTRNRLE